jgi:hypothetical protein
VSLINKICKEKAESVISPRKEELLGALHRAQGVAREKSVVAARFVIRTVVTANVVVDEVVVVRDVRDCVCRVDVV